MRLRGLLGSETLVFNPAAPTPNEPPPDERDEGGRAGTRSRLLLGGGRCWLSTELIMASIASNSLNSVEGGM